MLGYYSMSAFLTPFEFFHCRFDLLKVCFLYVITRPRFVQQYYKQVGSSADLFLSFWTDVHAIRPVDGFKTLS
jgi:hypothetical protein